MTEKINIKESLNIQEMMSLFPMVQTKYSQAGRIKEGLME